MQGDERAVDDRRDAQRGDGDHERRDPPVGEQGDEQQADRQIAVGLHVQVERVGGGSEIGAEAVCSADRIEEAAHADPSVQNRLSGECWIVDPLDGTNNFARGKPPFGILVAMASGGEAHTGWLYDPLSDRLCIAHRGKGAFINGEKVYARPSAAELPIATISLVFVEQSRREAMRQHIAPHYALVDIPRCAAEQYPRLVLGINDVSIFERTLAWDHAAGVLFLNEAGGKAARPDGSVYRVDEWQRPGLVGAASPALWDELAERLAALPD